MLSRSALAIAAVTALGVSGFASAAQRTVYVGGHNPARLMRTEPDVRATAPYALTGRESAEGKRFEVIRVGSRIVGIRHVTE